MDERRTLPGWILGWFYTTAAICTWDASFIVFRPETLPGGSLSTFWYPYKYYIVVDQRYSALMDDYVYAQSLLNYVEVVLNIIAIFMHYRKNRHTVPLAFTVTVMTFWKTVLYFLMYGVSDTYRKNNTLVQHIFLFCIPNGVWILLPLLAMIKLWTVFVPGEVDEGVPNIRRRKTKAS